MGEEPYLFRLAGADLREEENMRTTPLCKDENAVPKT